MDNISGVMGIGLRTAVRLLTAFENIKKILRFKKILCTLGTQNSLIKNINGLVLNQKLVKLNNSLYIDIDSLIKTYIQYGKVFNIIKVLNMKNTINKLCRSLDL